MAETSRTDFSLFTHIAAPPAVCRIIEDILTHSITALPVRWAHNIACPASVVACLDMGADAVAAGIILRTHNTAISAVAGIGGRINTGPVAFQVRGQADEETRATDTVGGLWRARYVTSAAVFGIRRRINTVEAAANLWKHAEGLASTVAADAVLGRAGIVAGPAVVGIGLQIHT